MRKHANLSGLDIVVLDINSRQSCIGMLFFLHENLMVGIIIVLVVAEYTIDGF